MNDTREVSFKDWCPKCEYAKLDEEHMNPDDPCWDCLHQPMAIDSRKPINFKEAHVESRRSEVKVESYTVSEN